ncbi:hypothetical protein TREES_T100017037 [Tupaia chinensis]|uniref:Uncharacterized protein n=1 Tax=Tupaia chinensis TaxID=246437 RepID=L9KZE1_TUPCH|nr:hypothetical protein TREES_T100017037 [Tupaia chinensis]
MGGACRGSPVLRCEPGHKESPLHLVPQDRGPEMCSRGCHDPNNSKGVAKVILPLLGTQWVAEISSM